MKKGLLLMAGVAMLFAACTKDGSNGVTDVNVNTVAKKAVTRAFSGSISYTATTNGMSCDCSPYGPAGTFEGTGNIKHLGETYSEIAPCGFPLFAEGASKPYAIHVALECAYFKAANGDMLYLHTHPYNLVFGPTGAVGTANVDIVGGTGRFANATGSFTGTVTSLGNTATFSGLNGTITY